MVTIMDTNSTNWLRFLSRWALFTALNYLGLILGILTLVMPASQGSPLPEIYFELVAATRAPILYRLTIAMDVAAWLALGGLLVTFAALFIRHAPIRSAFIAACGVSMVSGFIGACFRLAGTSALAATYLTALPGEQAAIQQSYIELLRLINILFSAGGFLGGIGLLLAGSTVWSMDLFPHWSNTMLILAGVMHMSKAAMELITGADLGPLALLANILVIIALFTIARLSWRGAPVRQPLAAS